VVLPNSLLQDRERSINAEQKQSTLAVVRQQLAHNLALGNFNSVTHRHLTTRY
jgi:hypothetical protein